MHAYSNADSAKGGGCVCVEERGRGISFNASALLSDSPSSHIYSVSSLHLFLSPRPPLVLVLSVSCHFFSVSLYFCLSSCQTYMLISLRHIISVTQHLSFTGLSVSFILSLLSLFSCSTSWILAAAPPSQPLYSAFTPWLCSLRQESAAN